MEQKTDAFVKKLFEKENLKRLIIILGLAGIALIFLSSFIDFDRFDAENQTDAALSPDEYCEELQARLKEIISSIDGVGRVNILLTIENSAEVVYQERTENQTKQIEPKIRGVVAVCDGGSDPVVVQRVINALQSALDIPASKICVTKLSD